jgi:outer membrane protein OmpA-like peptidoglycan-associated protein
MRGPVGYASSADRSRDRRGPAWLPLAAAALVVPTALAGLTLLWPRPQIEAGLARTASDSLSAAGLTGAQLTVTGRDATIAGLAGADGERAVEIVQGVTGVRVAQLAADGSGGTTDPGVATTEPAPAATEPFGITRRGDDVVLTGVVGSEEERAALVAAAEENGASVVDELTVTAGATAQEGVDAASVGAVAALLAATGDGVAATFDAGTLALTGTAPDSASAEAAGTALGAVLPGITVDNQLVVDGGGAAVPGAGPAGELDEAGKQELQAAIDAAVAGAPITFEPDSPELTGPGSDTVGAIAELVTLVPSARLQVDGFVATGPGAGVLTAQELSDQRAATERDALVAAGVPAGNVTATGRGEGDSPAAAESGRRADITVV